MVNSDTLPSSFNRKDEILSNNLFLISFQQVITQLKIYLGSKDKDQI